MRSTVLKCLVSLGLVLCAGQAMGQSRSGGSGEIFIDVDEPLQNEVPAPPPSVTPPPVPAPQPQPPRPTLLAYDDHALDAVTRPELTPFANEGEFRRYLGRFKRIKEQRRQDWAFDTRRADGIVIAAAFQDTAPIDPQSEVCTDPEKCPAESSDIVLTGSKVTPPSITNNQTVGVDEGDIVKQIGNYFLVLQDGRIFALNIRSMQLTDRMDVYRRDAEGEPTGADWYDEMLVQGDHILVTAYSYEDSATELSVFRLDQASGKLARLGVFLISSDDYYSADNYATRIVGDKLVLYAPYELDALEDRKDRPVIRRWMGPADREDKQQGGVPLIDAQHLYWPVMRTSEPTIHTVSICPLGEIATRDLRCRTTGFVAPARAQMYVSPENVYLWTTAMGEGDSWYHDNCATDEAGTPRPPARDVAPGVVYRVPVSGDDPGLLPVRGSVFDQFSMDESRGRFRALAGLYSERCDQQQAQVGLIDVSASQFRTEYSEASGRDVRALPAPGKRNVENRFIDDWLVYGGRDGWGSYPPDEDEGPQSAAAIAVPLKHPERVQVLQPGHEFIRVERVGNDLMMSGYRDSTGLRVSMIKLGETARIAGQLHLPHRFESEGRSHAFNSVVGPDGSGLLGIPTVSSEDDSGRWWWRSLGSDISFLSLDGAGGLGDIGFLPGKGEKDTKTADSYECEVSCIDWYGNSRPIFTEGRIFGLIATELVEAKVTNGRIGTIARIDLTQPVSAPMVVSTAP